MVANISIDFDPAKNEVYLLGDISALQKHRFAWRYVRDYLHPAVEADHITIPIGEKEPFDVMSDVSAMLSKYGFTEAQSDSSEKVIHDYYEEERRFAEFSKKALHIRNNDCDAEEFKDFTDSVAANLTARSLYPLQLLSAYHMAFSQNACNFSVPGAGKTSIVYGAYAYLHNLPEDDPKHIDRLLIVGPLSSFGPWEAEYEECFGRAPKSKRLVGGVPKNDKQDYLISRYPCELTLISYASLISLQSEIGFFLRNNRVMVVLDEAHKAKNSSGGIIAQAVLDMSRYSKARIVLTGTPAPNGYEDIYNMFKFIWPNKNVLGFEVNQLRDITATGDTARVTRLIDNISPYFIRIRKSDLNIPPATVHPPVFVPTMVDSNLQREHILPSEKAFAYKMKMEAMDRKLGRPQNVDQVGPHFRGQSTAQLLGDAAGDSASQVKRYIRLTNLIPEILQMVDDGKIALTPAVELSYLQPSEQEMLFSVMDCDEVTPSLSQAQRLRRMSEEQRFTDSAVMQLMSEVKGNQVEYVKVPVDKLRSFFRPDTSVKQMTETLVKAMDFYNKHLARQRKDRDAR